MAESVRIGAVRGGGLVQPVAEAKAHRKAEHHRVGAVGLASVRAFMQCAVSVEVFSSVAKGIVRNVLGRLPTTSRAELMAYQKTGPTTFITINIDRCRRSSPRIRRFLLHRDYPLRRTIQE
jgi:hypothetical protein